MRTELRAYDEAWHNRYMACTTITVETFWSRTDSWRHSPKLCRYRELRKEERFQVAKAYGQRVGVALTERGEPAVVGVELPYLDGFVEGVHSTLSVPFIFLALSGGDEPVTAEQQQRIAALPQLRACFAHNLHAPRDTDTFHPMPLGLPPFREANTTLELLLSHVLNCSPPWVERDCRLLLPPMRRTNRLRKQYAEVLSGEAYRDLVHVVNRHLSLQDFLQLLGGHKAVLSPPGRGYDCFRTWQAIAVGTVPLVVADAAFDGRLFEAAGPAYIPRPADLRPELLRALLSELDDPAPCAHRLDVNYWRSAWEASLFP